jgi:hypothetical protein
MWSSVLAVLAGVALAAGGGAVTYRIDSRRLAREP